MLASYKHPTADYPDHFRRIYGKLVSGDVLSHSYAGLDPRVLFEKGREKKKCFTFVCGPGGL